MRASAYVGRVGGLAVALGIGVATGGSGVAWAGPGDSSVGVEASDSAVGVDSSVSPGSGNAGPATRSRGGRGSRPAAADSAGDSLAPRDSRGADLPRAVDVPGARKNTVPAPVSAPRARPSSPTSALPSTHSGAAERVALPAMNTDTSSAGPAVLDPVTRAAATDPTPVTQAVSVNPDVPQMVVAPARPAAAGALDSVWSPLLGTNPGAPVESAVSWAMLAAARRELGGARTAPATAAVVSTGQVVAPAASTITVTTPNTAPTAVNDGPFTVAKGGSLTLTYAQLLGNDTDPDKATGDTLAVNSVSTATGTVTHNPTTKTVTYTPPATYTGPAGFIYRTKDSTGTTSANTATVAVTVNTAPVAGTTTVGTPDASTGTVIGSVTATDVNGDTLTYSGSTTTSKGTVVVNANGSFTYTPTATARHATEYSVIGTVAGIVQPDGVAISPDGSRGYISDIGSGSLKVFDTATNTVTASIWVGFPTGVAFSPDGSRVYVTNNINGTMSVIDAATNTVTGTVTGLNAPARVSITPDGMRAYVVDSGGALRMVDLQTNTVSIVQSGLYPSIVAVSPDGTRAYAAVSGTGNLSVIDLGKKNVTALIPGAGDVTDVVVSADSKRIYIAQRNSDLSGSVSIIDATTNKITATISLSGSPNAIAVNADGTRAYVTQSSMFQGAMSAIDLTTGTVIATTKDLSSPYAIAITRDGTRAYINQGMRDGIWVINVADTTDTFAVTVTDGYSGTIAVPVTVTISPANAQPVAGTQVVGTPNGTTGVVTGSVSASDPDGDALTYSGSTTTSKGTVEVGVTGSFTYTPTVAARRNAYLPGTSSANLSDTFVMTVTDAKGSSTAIPVTVTVSPALTYATGDVKRDPTTGQIALRTSFDESTLQPGTGIPGYLNWLIGTPNSGPRYGFPAEVASWENLFLVGTVPISNPYSPSVDLPVNSVLRNPGNGSVAIRTIFNAPDFANMSWLIATPSQGGLLVPSSSVQGWDVLFNPNRVPVAGTPVVGTPNADTGVVTGTVSATDADGDTLTYSALATTSKGAVTVNASTGAFTYTPTVTARRAAAKNGAVAGDKADTFTVTIADGYGGTASVPVTVAIGATAASRVGDIREQPGGTWRAIYAPNVTYWGDNWLGVNPGNGGIWLSDSAVNSWLDVAPPTGTETAGSGPYSPGDIKVPPQSVAGSVTWFAVRTEAPLSNIYSWMTCGVRNGCNTASDSDVIAGAPIAQWVDLKF